MGAPEAEIRKKYKALALKTHPDKNKTDPDAKQKFQRVSEAYKCLTDPTYVSANPFFTFLNQVLRPYETAAVLFSAVNEKRSTRFPVIPTSPIYFQVDDDDADVELNEEEMMEMFNAMFADMFDQMTEEFMGSAEMEGIPPPPREFLQAFMQQEMMNAAMGGFGGGDDDYDSDDEDGDLPPEMLAAMMTAMGGGSGLDPEMAAMMQAMGLGGAAPEEVFVATRQWATAPVGMQALV